MFVLGLYPQLLVGIVQQHRRATRAATEVLAVCSPGPSTSRFSAPRPHACCPGRAARLVALLIALTAAIAATHTILRASSVTRRECFYRHTRALDSIPRHRISPRRRRHQLTLVLLTGIVAITGRPLLLEHRRPLRRILRLLSRCSSARSTASSSATTSSSSSSSTRSSLSPSTSSSPSGDPHDASTAP